MNYKLKSIVPIPIVSLLQLTAFIQASIKSQLKNK